MTMHVTILKDKDRYEDAGKLRRKTLNICLNLMWDEFSEIVDKEDKARIGRFLMVKDLGHYVLSKDAGDSTEE